MRLHSDGQLLRDMRSGKSVFMRISILMAALLLVLSLAMMALLNGIARNNNRRVLAESNLNRIEAMDMALMQTVRGVSSMMTEMMWGKDLLDFMIGGGSVNETRDSRIVRQLANSVMGESNVIQRIFFGSYLSGKTYQNSSYKQLDAIYCDAYQFCMESIADGSALSLGRHDDTASESWLVHRGSRLFLLTNLKLNATAEQAMGFTICELNKKSLAAALSNGGDFTERSVFIFDELDRPVLNEVLDYSGIPEDVFESPRFITEDSIRNNQVLRRGLYYYHVGELGWQYLLPADQSGINVSLTDSLKVIFPIMILLLAVLFLIVFYAVRVLYQPIEALLDLVDPMAAKRPMTGKVDALADAYSAAQDRQERIQNTITALAPNIIESTIRQLLGGKNYSDKELREIFDSIDHPIGRIRRYNVCAVTIDEPENRSVSEREWNLYLVAVQNLIHEAELNVEEKHVVRMDRTTVAVLLVYSEDTSAVAIKRSSMELCQYLVHKTEPLPCDLWAEYGRICGNLKDIHESFVEAQEKIQYRRISADTTAAAEEPESETSENSAERAGMDRRYIRDKVKQYIGFALNGENDRALAVQHGLLDEIVELHMDLQTRRSLYKIYLDAIMEKVVTYPLTQEEQDRFTGDQAADVRIDVLDGDELNDFMEDRGRLLSSILGIYGRKNQYRYVEQAKAYIEEHYADSDLSLNDVAAHIGISSSYLSELFNEVNNVKFSAYLAEYRVEKARRMLRSTSATIRDVGAQCGFNSVQNFNRVFKKVSGYTPGQYREQNS